MRSWEICKICLFACVFENAGKITLDSAACDVDYSFESDLRFFFVSAVESHYEIVVDA